jgi:mono/diheme cytochrome c family protein
VRKTAVVLTISLAILFAPMPALADGAELYARRCASCHGKEGNGDTAIGKKKGLRALGSSEVQAQTDTELTARIARGGSEAQFAL